MGSRVGCQLPGTLVFDYPTASAITEYLAERLTSSSAPPSQRGQHAEATSQVDPFSSQVVLGGAPPQPAAVEQLVFVTAVRGRIADKPGDTGNTWGDHIQPVPLDRWDSDFGQVFTVFGCPPGANKQSPGMLGGRFGGFLLNWSSFDPEVFSIPPAGMGGSDACFACAQFSRLHLALNLFPVVHLASEAALMDPQQRLVLEATAGLLVRDNPGGDGQQTAVFVGIAKLGEPAVAVAGIASAAAAGSSFVGTGSALSAAAGRISYTYGLRGPSGAPCRAAMPPFNVGLLSQTVFHRCLLQCPSTQRAAAVLLALTMLGRQLPQGTVLGKRP